MATLNASSLNDGIHSLSVTASQTDGLSANFSTFFSTNAQSARLKNQLVILQGTLQSLNGAVSSLDARLESTSAKVADLTYLAYGLAIVVILSLVVALYALHRKPAALAVASAA
jgi:hypothetical protein